MSMCLFRVITLQQQFVLDWFEIRLFTHLYAVIHICIYIKFYEKTIHV